MTLAERIAALPANERWAVAKVQCTDEGATIAHALSTGEVISVSDGSFKLEHGTAAWVIEAASSLHRITGVGVIPGTASDQSAYRSELGGLFGIAVMVKVICEHHGITQGTASIACDGLSALQQSTDPEHIVRPTAPHFDLVTGTRKMLQQSPIHWTAHHVLGHQDDDPDATLDRWAILNIEMDMAAKEYWLETTEMEQRPPPLYQIAGEPWALWIGTTKICGGLQAAIEEAIHGPRSLAHWTKRGKFGNVDSTAVDWEATGWGMKAAKTSRRHWVSKHTSGFCATGRMMKRRQQRVTDECPRCHQANEDADHIWRCQDPRALEIWKSSIDTLESWLRRQNTAPGIITAICSGLLAWHRDAPRPPITDTFVGVQSTAAAQDELGWQSLLEGRPAVGWRETQLAYYQWIGSRRTGRRWITALVQKLWDVAWDQWEHRNHVLHDQDTSIANDIQTQAIKDQFALGSAGLLPEVRRMFRRGQRATLKLSPQYRGAWLQRVTTARARAERRRETAQNTYQTERAGMARFLQRLQPPG
jgi:putative intracellular protease/amidase